MNAPQMKDLDHLLSRAAPPSAPDGPALDAALGALVDEARTASAPRRRWRRRALWTGAAAVGIGLAGAGAVAVLPDRPVTEQPFMEPAEEWAAHATDLEWIYTDLDGYRCAMRLTGFDLTDAQADDLRARLGDAAALLTVDDGAVRAEFLARYDEDEHKQAIYARDEYAGIIDEAYAEVAELDAAAGTAELDGVPLTDASVTGAASELFHQTYGRLVLDGIGAGPQRDTSTDAALDLTPQFACEVGE